MRNVLWAVAVLVLSLATSVSAQLRGMGRVQGTVVDESGAPLTEVTIKATLVGSNGSIEVASNGKGEWAVGGMGKGEWVVTFDKTGYAPRRAKVSLPVELARVPPVPITMKKS